MRFRDLLVGLSVLLVGMVVRVALIHTADPPLTRDDLHQFEETYGLDLPEWYESRPFFLFWTRGDGQAFVVLANDLTGSGPARELAVPVYRYSRVGYAAVGRLVVLGSKALVPVGLLVVNAAALYAAGMLSSRMARRRGPAAFLLAANPALFVGFASDTAEPLGVVLLIGAIAATGSVAGIWAGMLAAVRPSFATALPVRGPSFGLLLIPFAIVALTLRMIGISALGSDTSIPSSTVVVPFAGYFDAWQSLPINEAVVAGIPLFAALVTIYLGVTRKSGLIRLSWVASGALVLTFGPLVLENPHNWIRAGAALPVLWGLSQRSQTGSSVSSSANP